jgi:hypothetical protein
LEERQEKWAKPEEQNTFHHVLEVLQVRKNP